MEEDGKGNIHETEQTATDESSVNSYISKTDEAVEMGINGLSAEDNRNEDGQVTDEEKENDQKVDSPVVSIEDSEKLELSEISDENSENEEMPSTYEYSFIAVCAF